MFESHPHTFCPTRECNPAPHNEQSLFRLRDYRSYRNNQTALVSQHQNLYFHSIPIEYANKCLPYYLLCNNYILYDRANPRGSSQYTLFSDGYYVPRAVRLDRPIACVVWLWVSLLFFGRNFVWRHFDLVKFLLIVGYFFYGKSW